MTASYAHRKGANVISAFNKIIPFRITNKNLSDLTNTVSFGYFRWV